MKEYTGGYIKLYRELKKKAIWRTSTNEQKVILITLLLMVNWEEVEWEWKGKKFTCKPGQMITSIKKIIDECGGSVSRQNIRTALERFEKYEFLTKEVTNANHLITICNWEQYQEKKNVANQETNQWVTNGQPMGNQWVTTNEEYKEEKEYKKNNILLDEKKIVEDKNEENQKPKNLPQKKTEKQPDFIDGLITLFAQKYFNEFQVEYIPTAGDKKHMSWILSETKKFKKRKNEKFDTNDTVEYFNQYFSAVVKIKEPFIRKNLTIAILKSQFNQVNRILKDINNGKNQSNPNNPSDEELINAIKQGAERAGGY